MAAGVRSKKPAEEMPRPTHEQMNTAERILRHGAEHEPNGKFLMRRDLQALVALIDSLRLRHQV